MEFNGQLQTMSHLYDINVIDVQNSGRNWVVFCLTAHRGCYCVILDITDPVQISACDEDGLEPSDWLYREKFANWRLN